jgi:anti-sigma B factor antagonist
MSADSPSQGQNWYGAAPLRAGSESIAPGVVLVRLSGDLDLDTSGAADELIRSRIVPSVRLVLLDLSAVTFCSSSGLRVLVGAARFAAERHVVLRLVGAGRPILRPLEITRLDQRFEFFASVDAAVAAGVSSGSDG